MSNIRIQNVSPNLRVNNASPSIKLQNATSNMKIGNVLPSTRTMQVLTAVRTSTVTFGGKGYPLGILLSITGTKSNTVTNYSGGLLSPNMRIFNI